MNKVILSLGLVTFLLSSCGNSTNDTSNNQTEISEVNVHHHNDDREAIELNNIEKWKVDANRLPQIRIMENDVISFAKVEQNDFKTLSEKLQLNIDLFTANGTMNGKAHDELHKWLLPYIDFVKELSEAKDETEATKQFENIQIAFTTFNQYFQ